MNWQKEKPWRKSCGNNRNRRLKEMGERIYEFEAVIEPVPDKGGAYVLSL